MKVTLIVNGVTSMVLTPENDVEKLLIAKLEGCVVVKAKEQMRVMDQPLADSLIIKEGIKAISDPTTKQ